MTSHQNPIESPRHHSIPITKLKNNYIIELGSKKLETLRSHRQMVKWGNAPTTSAADAFVCGSSSPALRTAKS